MEHGLVARFEAPIVELELARLQTGLTPIAFIR